MNLQLYYLSITIIGFILFGILVIVILEKIRDLKGDVRRNQDLDQREFNALENRINFRIDLLINMLTAKKTTIPPLAEEISHLPPIADNGTSDTETGESIKPGQAKHETQTSPPHQPGSIMSLEQGIKAKNIEDSINKDNGELTAAFNGTIPSSLSSAESERLLENLLHQHEFLNVIWQQFSKPFDACALLLSKYLAEHGLPIPKIEPYPPLQDGNPKFWIFMIVQAQTWMEDQKRFVIPQNYYKYDQLWHGHLFNVRGNLNRSDNFIKKLKHCAVLGTGKLSDNIDKKIVQKKGEISVD